MNRLLLLLTLVLLYSSLGEESATLFVAENGVNNHVSDEINKHRNISQQAGQEGERMKVNQPSLHVRGDVLETLKRCGGYYKRPPGGPLVGYAGTYDVNVHGESCKRHFVGFEYFNCSKAEQYPLVRFLWAEELARQYAPPSQVAEVILGAPMGGILFADSLAMVLGCRVVFAEKRVKARSETVGGRDETGFVLDRHDIEHGDVVVIVEDVCNNFSTTAELVKLIISCGATPLSIACIVNRSSASSYTKDDLVLPVTNLAYLPTEQFKQEDPAVAEDVRNGNVVWKPKIRENWLRLMKIMNGEQS